MGEATNQRVTAFFLSAMMILSIIAMGVTPVAGASTSEGGVLDGVAAAQNVQTVDLSIDQVEGQAGGANSTLPVEVKINVTKDGSPYLDSVEQDMLDIEIGTENVTKGVIVDDNAPPGEYILRFLPPKQSSAGDYDLDITFTDVNANGHPSDSASRAKAITYSQGEANQISTSLILDESGSMGGVMDEMRNGASTFVERAKAEDYISVVSYDDQSFIKEDLAQLQGNRTRILNTIDNLTDGGSTNIGDAMNDGLTTLGDSPNGTREAAVLMTDGNLNTGPTESEILNTIVPKFNNRGICLYTIGFGDGADEQLMKDIANESDCGFYRFAAESGDAAEAQATLQEVFEDIQQDVSQNEIFYRNNGTLSANETVQASFSVDPSATVARFTAKLAGADLSGLNSMQMSPLSGSGASILSSVSTQSTSPVTLYDPSGAEVDPETNDDVEQSVVGDTVIYRLNDPESGEWSYELENPESDEIDYETEVTGSSQTSLEVSTLSDSYNEDSQATLSATMLDSNGPITDATVTAEVTTPSGTETISLSQTANGVYEGTVTGLEQGDYSATITAQSGSLTRTKSLSWSVSGTGAYEITPSGSPEIEPGGNATVNFDITRPGSAGSQNPIVQISDLAATSGGQGISSDELDISTQSVSVSANGGTETVSVTINVPEDAEPGDYKGTLQVFGSLVTKSFSVTVPGDGGDAKQDFFDVSNLNVPDTVEKGQEATVTATITNTGNGYAQRWARLFVDGERVGGESLRLAGGESETVEFTVPTENLAGEHEIAVQTNDDRDTATMSVVEPGEFELDTIEPGEIEATPGEERTVSATIVNVGASQDTSTITLSLGNTVLETRDVTLDSGESKTVEFTMQTPNQAGDYGYSIELSEFGAEATGTLTVLEPASFELGSLDPQTAEVETGEEVTVATTVSNTGDVEETSTVEFVVSGQVVETRDVTLAGGESQTVQFTLAPPQPGEYTHSIRVGGSQVSGDLTVMGTPEFDLDLVSRLLDVEPGEELTVNADVMNVGDAEGTTDVELRVDGQVVDTAQYTLGASEDQSVEFTITAPMEPGEYSVTLVASNIEIERTLTVVEEETPTPTPTETATPTDTPTETATPTDEMTDTQTDEMTDTQTDEMTDEETDTATATEEDGGDGGGPGFGIVAALLAVLGVALLARRRR
jgi:PGF-CTERM protein